MIDFSFLENYSFSPNTKLAGVIGDPISQSLSPYLHNYLLRKYKIDGIYIPLKVSTADFPKFLKTLPELGFSGCNVTMPHKEIAVKLCDNLSESAKQIGAVNTITFEQDGKVFGDNSDHFGFIQNIKNIYPYFNFKNKKILLLGSGGASRAIVFGLLESGVVDIVVANRNIERAKDLAKSFRNVSVINWQERSKNLVEFDMVINSTSLGMELKEGLEIDLSGLKKEALVCDIIYKPLMTNFLISAQKQSNLIVTGIGMLIYQGLIGFEKWFGVKPEIDQKLIDKMVELSGKNNL